MTGDHGCSIIRTVILVRIFTMDELKKTFLRICIILIDTTFKMTVTFGGTISHCE